jgi:glycerate dehydrogenase
MTKPRCVVLDGWTLTEHVPGNLSRSGEPSWAPIAEMVELEVYPRSAPAERLTRAQGAELILTNKVVLDRPLFEALSELSYVGVLATGTNVVDLAAAKACNVVVTNVPGYATESVVAHVFGLILELEMRTTEHARAVTEGGWSQSPDFSFRLGSTLELAGRCIGIVGYGNIGKRVAEVARAFGLRVLVATRPGKALPADAGVEFCDVDRLFAEADIISLHCPLVPETEKLVDAQRLARMKPDAILINTGRGPLVDEPALLAALAAGRIRGAGLDVLSTEPPLPNHPLLGAPRCLVTPHLAWATTAARQRLMHIVTSNIAAYLAGAPTNRVA